MATINLGAIKFNWKGPYNNGTAYAVDDVVSSGGSSYVCILASTGNAVSNGTYWQIMSSAGTNGTDIGTTLTTQGDILYRDGSGLQRLPKGTAGQVLKMNSGATAPEYGVISSGEYSLHKIDSYNYHTQISSGGSASHYVDIAGGNSINFTPTHVNDLIFISHYINFHYGDAQGGDAYIMMKAGASTIGSGDTKINYGGNHTTYIAGANDNYHTIHKSFILPCTNLSVGTTYYIEQAGASHSSGTTNWNSSAGGHSAYISGINRHHCMLIHYKKN